MASAIPIFTYESTFGVLIVTAFVSIFLAGVTTVQSYMYAVSYGKDPLAMRILVLLVWLLSMSHAALISYAGYHYTVTAMSTPLIILKIHWSALVALLISSIEVFVVQVFLAWRVYSFLNASVQKWKTNCLFVLVLLCILGNLGTSISGTAKVFTLESTLELLTIRKYLLVTLGFNISVDILVTFFLAFALFKTKTGIPQSDQALRYLTIYTVNSGLMPCLLAVSALISYIYSPYTFGFLFCIYILSDTYANCLLANLNSRSFFKGKMHSQGTDLETGNSSRTKSDFVFRVGSSTYISSVQGSVHHELDNMSPMNGTLGKADRRMATDPPFQIKPDPSESRFSVAI